MHVTSGRGRRGRGVSIPLVVALVVVLSFVGAVLYFTHPARTAATVRLEQLAARSMRTSDGAPSSAPVSQDWRTPRIDDPTPRIDDPAQPIGKHAVVVEGPSPTPVPHFMVPELLHRDQSSHLKAALGVKHESSAATDDDEPDSTPEPPVDDHRRDGPVETVDVVDAPAVVASHVEEPWKTFPEINTVPLSPHDRAIARAVFATESDDAVEAPDDVDLHKVDNAIAALYRDIQPLPKDDPILRRFRGPMWAKRPLLATVLRRWIVLNRQVRQGKRKGRVVQVNPVGQLCNRLVAITSAFTFALMTGRALQIEDGGFYCQMSDLFMEPGFNWVSLGAAGLSGDSHHLQNPEGGVWTEMEPLLCSDYTKHYRSPTVVFSINQYLVPYFTTNPHHRPDLLQLFTAEGADTTSRDENGDVFTPAAHFLFRPLDMLLQMRDKYIAEHFHGRFVVGLQVRSGGDFTDNFMSEKDWGLYKHCAESAVPASKGDSLKFFVATDTPRGRQAAIDVFGRDKVMFGPGEFLLSNHPRGVQMALLDLLLLAAADDRVTTAWSSYGYFAAGFSGVPTNTVVDKVPDSKLIAPKGVEQRFMGIMHKSDRRQQCVRLPMHQPCFHKFESWGASKATCTKWEWFEREMLNGRYC